jgi:sigma-B regulation protein RsbU (phosphoserine phosphatase)
LRADASAVLLPHESDGPLVFKATSGWHADPAQDGVNASLGPDTGPGLVMRTREALVLSDVSAEVPEICSWVSATLAGEGFRAHALVPLVVDSRALGVLMLNTREPRELSDDDIRLLQLIANQGALAIEQARMHREEIEQRRLQQELVVARSIQLGLMPREMPLVPGWAFAAHYQAAEQVGGDFYDIFAIPDGSGAYGIVVADVADKGVPAALIMAAGRTLIRGIALDGKSPAAALTVANRVLLEDGDSGLFVTALFGRLDPAAGRLTFANAGHMRPLRAAAGGVIEELKSVGIALGVIHDIELEEVTVTLEPGDSILLYTDGVTDAASPDYQRFGPTRLWDAIAAANRAGDARPAKIVESVRSAVSGFVGAAAPADDLTLFALGRAAG